MTECRINSKTCSLESQYLFWELRFFHVSPFTCSYVIKKLYSMSVTEKKETILFLSCLQLSITSPHSLLTILYVSNRFCFHFIFSDSKSVFILPQPRKQFRKLYQHEKCGNYKSFPTVKKSYMKYNKGR